MAEKRTLSPPECADNRLIFKAVIFCFDGSHTFAHTFAGKRLSLYLAWD